MRLVSVLAFSLLAVSLPSVSAMADGAHALCSNEAGLAVEVDFLKNTMRFSYNGTQTKWTPILEQGLTEEKLVALATGTPENPAVLVMNNTVGTESTFIIGGRRVLLVCR